jgi:hypothetical protein
MFVTFMNRILNSVERYKDAVVRSGFDEIEISSLMQTTKALEKNSINHDQLLHTRKFTNEERVVVMNELWQQLVLVCDTGKHIFSNNFCKYKNYVIHTGRRSNEDLSREDNCFEGVLDFQEVQLIHEIPYNPQRKLILENPGIAELKFFISESVVHDFITGGSFHVDTRNRFVINLSDLGRSGNYLFVKNMEKDFVGEYSVSLEEPEV